MSISLDALEQRISQLIALCGTLSNENAALRQQVSGLETEKQALAAKIDVAAERLEALMEQLPAE